MKHTKVKLLPLLLALIVLPCACGQQPMGTTGDGGEPQGAADVILSSEAYAALSANEYSKHLRSVFISLMPECMDASEYGLGVFSHYYGAVETAPDELDQVVSKGGGIYWITESSLPAFYGLLNETEQLLTSGGKLRREGDTTIIDADEVEACARMLLRSDVSVLHRSTAGAEYDEAQRCYRYTQLTDPLKPYYDKGWELIFLGDEQEEDPGTETFATYPFWQDTASGDLYSFDGELLCTKCQRMYLTGNLYTNYMMVLQLWHYGDNAIPLCATRFSYAVDENGEALPYDSTVPAVIRLGTGSMQIPDLSAYADAPIGVDIVLDGEGT